MSVFVVAATMKRFASANGCDGVGGHDRGYGCGYVSASGYAIATTCGVGFVTALSASASANAASVANVLKLIYFYPKILFLGL